MATTEEDAARKQKRARLKKEMATVEVAIDGASAEVKRALKKGLADATLPDYGTYLMGLLLIDGKPGVVLFEQEPEVAIGHWNQPWLRDMVRGFAEDGADVRFDVALMTRQGDTFLGVTDFEQLWHMRPKKPEAPAPKPAAKKPNGNGNGNGKKTAAPKKTTAKRSTAKRASSKTTASKKTTAAKRTGGGPRKTAAKKTAQRRPARKR